MVSGIVGQFTIFRKFLGKGLTVRSVSYYTGVFLSTNWLIGYLVFDETLKTTSMEMARKYESHLLTIDPKLKRVHDNYQIKDISLEYPKNN